MMYNEEDAKRFKNFRKELIFCSTTKEECEECYLNEFCEDYAKAVEKQRESK